MTGTATYAATGLPGGVGTIGPLGWQGRYTDAETGFVYLRARYYDTWIGQYLTRDPLEMLARSPYGYADGDALNRADPTGLQTFIDLEMTEVFEGDADGQDRLFRREDVRSIRYFHEDLPRRSRARYCNP